MGRIRVLLADDQPVVFESVRKILEPDYEVVGEVEDGLALLAAAQEVRPDVIVADIAMPGLDGIEAARRIRKTNQNVRIVFLTVYADTAYAAAAMKAGGSAYVLKSSAGEDLLAAITAALDGRTFVTTALAEGVGRQQRP